jgi:TPR repeat protein
MVKTRSFSCPNPGPELVRSLIGIIVAVLISASGAAAETLDDAVAAFNRQDYTTALQLLEPSADNNDLRAQFYLGMTYLLRTDESRDYAEDRAP